MTVVVHQPEQSRFIVTCEGGPAVLEYVQEGGLVDFHHTWVPPQHRGSRIALALVEAGLAWARAEGRDIRASCWYVQKVLDRQS